MKKESILGCLLAAAFLTGVGTAYAQTVPQGYSKADGYQYYEIGTYPQGENGEIQPLLWRALDVTDQHALLLSEYVIDAQQVIFETDETIIAKHAYRRIASLRKAIFANG
jgi:hypothetical protein